MLGFTENLDFEIADDGTPPQVHGNVKNM